MVFDGDCSVVVQGVENCYIVGDGYGVSVEEVGGVVEF